MKHSHLKENGRVMYLGGCRYSTAKFIVGKIYELKDRQVWDEDGCGWFSFITRYGLEDVSLGRWQEIDENLQPCPAQVPASSDLQGCDDLDGNYEYLGGAGIEFDKDLTVGRVYPVVSGIFKDDVGDNIYFSHCPALGRWELVDNLKNVTVEGPEEKNEPEIDIMEEIRKACGWRQS